MKASECKVGDRIALYTNASGNICDPEEQNSTLEATVIRITPHEDVMIGWKQGETAYKFARSASEFATQANRQAASNWHKSIIISGNTEVMLLIPTSAQAPVPTSPVIQETPAATSLPPDFDWDRYNGLKR